MKTLILCDSGLGGLDIAAPFFRKNEPVKWDLIYINAFPDRNFGYNDLRSSRMQEDVFQAVLEGMERFSPALCMIACNTLSIVWERLARRYTPSFPVIGIVEKAVCGMMETARQNPDAHFLILGTATTIASQVYPSVLLKNGIEPERIHSLACPGLAKLIEQDPEAPEVRCRIREYAEQAHEQLSRKPAKLFLSFCCTHYGYAESFWMQEFRKYFPGIGIINPNRMLNLPGSAGHFSYYSRIPLGDHQRQAMSNWFAQSAPPIAAALQSAETTEELFRLPQGIQIS